MESLNAYAFALEKLSEHRGMVNRSHEMFLDFVYHSMRTEKEALLLKMSAGPGLPSKDQAAQQQSIWDRWLQNSPGFSSTQHPQFSYQQISEFSTGSLVKCFGDHYAIYDGRKAPRTPNGDLLLMSRILEVKGTLSQFKQPASLTAEYDVPADAWFFEKNAAPVMPYSIIMEIALQPCGFLATFMGCTLIYPNLELCFRNLDSTAHLLKDLDLRNRTITANSKLTTVASSAETVIVKFDYELAVENETFFKGDTSFGYFTPNALANQVGMDRGERTQPWYVSEKVEKSAIKEMQVNDSETRQRFFVSEKSKPHFYQPFGQLNFLDTFKLVSNGGHYGLGYIYGEKSVDPEDWFFPCHFYQDPVMPGSLGVESILEAIRLFAIDQDLGASYQNPYFTSPLGTVIWKYRGQIIKSDKKMSIEVHIKSIAKESNQTVIKADANLWKDGLRIYSLEDASVAIAEASI